MLLPLVIFLGLCLLFFIFISLICRYPGWKPHVYSYSECGDSVGGAGEGVGWTRWSEVGPFAQG